VDSGKNITVVSYCLFSKIASQIQAQAEILTNYQIYNLLTN
jgi:hypothetical protein